MRHVQWMVVFLLLWLSTVLFRLAYATDVQNWTVWWASLVVAFGLPVAIGYNLAYLRFYNSTHSVCFEDDENDASSAETEGTP